MSVIGDPKADAVLARLHELSTKQSRSWLGYYLLKRRLRSRLTGRPTDWDKPPMRQFLLDKLVALDPDKCELCYLLCRALGATRIVEVGTSFAVSTIYLAAAARDNHREGETPGIVIGTECEPEKIAAASSNIAEAGLADFVDIRGGDARQTLEDVGGPIDFVLIDVWAPVALPALKLLAPQLRPGAVVACDNVRRFRREYAAYLRYVRNPRNGFRSMTLAFDGGFELSLRLSSPSGHDLA